MAAIKYKDIVSNIKNKVFHPIYLLQGEETFFIDEICRLVDENVLMDAEKEFNQTVVYGRDIDVPSLVAMAKRYPMMSNHQVIIVKEAQGLKNINALASYAENPQPTTILVLAYKYGKIDGRKKLAQTLKAKKHLVFEAKKLYDNQIPHWIEEYISNMGYRISPSAAMLLSENLGNDLSRITNEINKLFISLSKGEKIDADAIEKNIGISKEFNIFELQRALGEKNIVKSNNIINHFASDPKKFPVVMLIPILFNYFSNLMMIHAVADKSQRSVSSALSINPYFYKEYMSAYRNYTYAKLMRIISYLREYDMMSKGWNTTVVSDEAILKELVFKILH